LALAGTPPGLSEQSNLIRENANKAILYLGEYLRWEGVLDFVVRWDNNNRFSWTGNPGFYAYGGVLDSGLTFAQHESIFGEDLNGEDYDLGAWINPSSADDLYNYGQSMFIDPNASVDPDTPIGETGGGDFLSVFLHEITHGLGFWSTQQHEGISLVTKFDQSTDQYNDGNWYFTGPYTVEYFGSPVMLAATGSRDHYSHTLPIMYNLNREYGLYNEKWNITNLELLMLKDLGLNVVNFLDGYSPENITNDNSFTEGYVYRLRNDSTGKFIFSSNSIEIDIITGQGWVNEGAAYASPSSATTDLYRFMMASGGHFYTSNIEEKNILSQDSSFTYEGVAYQVYSTAEPPQGSIPVVRYLSNSGSHLYSTSELEQSNLNASDQWKNEGIAWYGESI